MNIQTWWGFKVGVAKTIVETEFVLIRRDASWWGLAHGYHTRHVSGAKCEFVAIDGKRCE